MSRFSFSTIISLPEENDSDFEDLLGYSLYSWELHGVVGFDISLNTYFMNMEGSWIFGGLSGGTRAQNTAGEIPELITLLS